MNRKRALVIGGTGMLKDVCIYLATSGYEVYCIARSYDKLNSLKENCPSGSFHAMRVDYNSDEVFEMVEEEVCGNGTFDLIVSWMPNYRALEEICYINGRNPFRLIHVKGSRRYFEDEPIQLPATCCVHKVFLGFILNNSGSRWLSHTEIAKGVIEAIEADRTITVVGQIEAYEKRPR